MSTTKPCKPVTTRINALLKKAGHQFILHRGRGYYYFIDKGEDSIAAGFHSGSLYVCWLEATEEDFQFALHHVNAVFKEEGIPALIAK